MDPSKDCITDLVDDYISIDDYYELKRKYDGFCRWSSYSWAPSALGKILCDAEKEGMIDANTRKDFEDWFGKLCKGESSSEDLFQQFKTLVTTYPEVSMGLYHRLRILFWTIDEINKELCSLRSSDQVVLEMKKSAAMSQSVVLGDHFDFTGFAGLNDKDEIPVQVPCLVLAKIISFCNKNHKFNSIIEGAVNHLKGIVNDYMDWITSFVKSNKPLFSHLHQAADYLHIPALLELTSMAVGDMKERSVKDISDWYAELSISRMLSPLGGCTPIPD